jgi:hypothetical protein
MPETESAQKLKSGLSCVTWKGSSAVSNAKAANFLVSARLDLHRSGNLPQPHRKSEPVARSVQPRPAQPP